MKMSLKIHAGLINLDEIAENLFKLSGLPKPYYTCPMPKGAILLHQSNY